jgi:hypothetical protein
LRDLRLDFFRGLAVYMIFVDHVSNDPLRKFTYQMIGFSDAAELFVFLSGLACGIAYSRTFAHGGLFALTAALARRVGRIYLFYVLSSVSMILLVAAAMKYMGLQDSLALGAEQPSTAILSALLVSRPPALVSILILYIILTSIVVPAIILVPERYRILTLAISGAIWLASQFLHSYTEPITQVLFFNPLAWQFLFAIGVTLGMCGEQRPSTIGSIFQQRWLVVAAWVVTVGAMLARVLSYRSGFDVTWLRFDPATAEIMKENLSTIRLVHFLSVAYLVAFYLHREAAFLKWPISRPVIKTGMHSLEVFSLSVLLDTAVNILVALEKPSLGQSLAMDGLAFLVLGLTATALASRRAKGALRSVHQ